MDLQDRKMVNTLLIQSLDALVAGITAITILTDKLKLTDKEIVAYRKAAMSHLDYDNIRAKVEKGNAAIAKIERTEQALKDLAEGKDISPEDQELVEEYLKLIKERGEQQTETQNKEDQNN